MIADWTGAVWKKLPLGVRSRIVRLTQAKFTVSAAAVVANERSEVLLLNHVIRPKFGWGLPGGFIERGEQPEEGIKREIREETGIELTDLRMFRIRTLGTHIEVLFKARSSGTPTVKSREIKELGWFAVGGMPNEMNPAQKVLIEEVLRQGV